MHHQKLISAFALIAIACSSSDQPSESPEPVSWPAREAVERLVPQFAELARQRVDSVTVRDAMRTRLETEARRSWNARIDGGLKYADLLLDAYTETDFSLSFATRNGTTPRAAGVVARLNRADEDALDDALYHRESISVTAASLAAQPPAETDPFTLSAHEAELAVSWLERRETEDGGPASRALIDAMLGLSDEPALSARLSDLADDHRTRTAPRAEAIAELELRVADAALRFARDMWHFNYRRLSWRELENAGGGKKVVYARLNETLRALWATDSADDAESVLLALRPPLEQYDRLVVALARYRAMTPWQAVTPDTETWTANETLRARLATEGFDAPHLTEAVAAYQQTHQFELGAPTAGFWRSLNVSHERRVRQIELTLQRYRETYYRGESDYVFVNIPDFHVEVFRDSIRKLRLPVVVGNTDRVCDPETRRWKYPNQTPVQWAVLDHLMLNPWWHVPPRLFDEEIAPHADDVEWLSSRGYELFERGGGVRARQRPGPKNALGLVKFIFPNEHDTYMHDTPHKQYFARPVRTFSHGCVRVEQPLELAEYLMTTYDLGGRERLDRIMELGSTIKIEIDAQVPVFFEYYTVRVDDDGRTWFLADPYRLDEQRLAGEELGDLCDPPNPSKPDPAAAPQVDDEPPDLDENHGP